MRRDSLVSWSPTRTTIHLREEVTPTPAKKPGSVTWWTSTSDPAPPRAGRRSTREGRPLSSRKVQNSQAESGDQVRSPLALSTGPGSTSPVARSLT